MKREPVKVRSIKDTRNPHIKQVAFEQEVEKPVTNSGSFLNFALAGAPNFGSNTQTRVAFHSFSPKRIEELGLVEGGYFPEGYNAKLVVHEFCEGDIIPEEVKGFYENSQTFSPRKFEVNGEEKVQLPKIIPASQGKASQTLTYKGKPIYRNTFLAVDNMVDADILITHDNQIVGTTSQLQLPSHVSEGGDIRI